MVSQQSLVMHSGETAVVTKISVNGRKKDTYFSPETSTQIYFFHFLDFVTTAVSPVCGIPSDYWLTIRIHN